MASVNQATVIGFSEMTPKSCRQRTTRQWQRSLSPRLKEGTQSKTARPLKTLPIGTTLSSSANRLKSFRDMSEKGHCSTFKAKCALARMSIKTISRAMLLKSSATTFSYSTAQQMQVPNKHRNQSETHTRLMMTIHPHSDESQ